MKTRIIHTKIWEDEWFTALSKEAKLLFLYLISNQRINLCGAYEITDRVIIFESGLKKSELQKAKNELVEKVIFYEEWIYVKNATRHGGYKGEKNETANTRELSNLPENIRKCFIEGKCDRVSVGYLYPIDTPINHKSEIINHKSEIKEEEIEKNLPGDELEKKLREVKLREERGKNTLTQKTEDFILEVKEITSNAENTNQTEIEKFCSYWTEPNKSKSKLRWELQPTFDIPRRLGTWFMNDKNFSNNNKPKIEKYEPAN